MRMISFAYILFFLLGFTTPGRTAIIQLDPVLQEYIREALNNNPDLISWNAKLEAAQHSVPQAGALPDPMVTIGILNLPVNTFRFDQEPMTGAWININQTIPIAGVYGLKKDIAERSLDRTSWDLQSHQLEIAREIVQTWYDWEYLIQAAIATDTTIQLLNDLLKIAEIKYQTGKGLLLDLMRLRTEKARTANQKIIFEQMNLTTGRKLAALLGRDPAHPPDPPRPEQYFFPDMDRQILLSQAVDRNPQLASAEIHWEISQSKVKLAKRLWWPELRLGVGYGYRQDAENGMERPDFFSATAGVTLPVFGFRKQSPAVQESYALQRQTEARMRMEELQLKLKIETLMDEDERLAEQIKRYQTDIIPDSKTALDASISSYSAGKTDVEAVIAAQSALIQVILEEQSRITERLKLRASLAALIGDYDLKKDNSPLER